MKFENNRHQSSETDIWRLTKISPQTDLKGGETFKGGCVKENAQEGN